MTRIHVVLIAALAAAGCAGSPAGGTAAGGGPGAPPASPPGDVRLQPATAIEAADLDGCQPAGTWIAEGKAQGAGTCTAAPATMRLELVVRAAGPGRWEARRSDGRALRLERLRGTGGRCEVDVEEVAGGPAGSNLVLFYHLADAGAGLAVRDEYAPAAGDFRPETGRVRCTESYDLTVTRRAAPR